MERIIHRLLLAWLLVLGGVLLMQVLPFSGSEKIGYYLMLVVVFGCPLVVLAVLWRVVLGLREGLHRLRVLRRAVKWKREAPATGAWLEEDWTKLPPR